jgi:hypothetical protein
MKHSKDGYRDIANLPHSSKRRIATTDCTEHKVDELITKD